MADATMTTSVAGNGFAFRKGQIVSGDLASQMIEAGHAVPVREVQKAETAASKAKVEKAAK